jgi:hypothetical protein
MRHFKERRLVVAQVAFGILAGVASGRAQAYPIPPVTLWDLVKQADTIVLATVENERSIERGRGASHNWSDTVALLSVQEAWKGSAAGQIQVPYPRGMICPAPPRYEAGLTVLAFLTHDRKGARATVGLSYGTLYPEPGELPVFRELVRQAAAAQSIENEEDQERARVDWLVRAASEVPTRWHGLYALAPDGDALHSFYDDRKQSAPALTPEHIEQLARAFVAAPALDFTLPMMLKILDGHPNAAVDETAVAATDTVLDATHPPYWAADLVALTLRRLGKSPPPDERRARGDQDALDRDPLLGGLNIDAPKLRAQWSALRKQLPFARRTLDRPPNAGVHRTGATTPP